MSIAPIQLPAIAPIEIRETGAAAAPDLAEVFGKALDEARALNSDATKAAEQFANGDAGVGIHEVMIASEKANIAVRYATTMKNKAVEAYRELMNTQV